MITAQALRAIMLGCGDRADAFAGPLSEACDRFDIRGPKRLSAFLAQIAHESGELRHTVENLNYSADALRRLWPNRFPAALALECARNPERIACIAYGGRMGNGDEASGDGWKFRGRGLIQLTGRDNYGRCAEAIGIELLDRPELLERPDGASLSAAWFWADKRLNELADIGDFAGITKRINGGLTGQDQRVQFWTRAQQAFSGA